MVNVSEITFGVEIECFVPVRTWGSRQVGAYHWGVQVADLPAGWKVETDSSLSTTLRGYRGVEIVSPKLKGVEGLRQVKAVCHWLNTVIGAKVNKSCGIHVTVEFPAYDAAALARLVLAVSHYEKGLFASTGTKARERGIYCNGINKYGATYKTSKAKANEATKKAKNRRYHLINLTHLARGRSRVEFRVFSGSTNATKIISWIRLAVAMVEHARNTSRNLPFDNRANHPRWGGHGQAHLAMLLNRIGWMKTRRWGYDGHTYGDLTADDLPSHKESTKLLRRLAKKYDAAG